MMKQIKHWYRMSPVSCIFDIALYLFIISIGIYQTYKGQFTYAGICLGALVLLTIPYYFQSKKQIYFPTIIKIAISLFIFCTQILGEIFHFYTTFAYWDSILHAFSGFFNVAIGLYVFSLIIPLKKIQSYFATILFAVCFSMTLGMFWECFEYAGDRLLQSDMQKDTVITSIAFQHDKKNIAIKDINKTIIRYKDKQKTKEFTIDKGYIDIGLYDTMNDTFINLGGAIVFAGLGYIYLKNPSKHKYIALCIPYKINKRES